MAIVINQSPQQYSHSGNPLDFVFDSDQTGQDNFSYKVNLYIEGVLKETHFILPEFGSTAHFDMADIAERYSNTPVLQDDIIYTADNFISALKLEVFENYGTPPVDQLSATSTIVVYKGKMKKSKFLTYNSANYRFGANKLWLTLFPRADKRYIDLSFNNKFMFLTADEIIGLAINLYTSAGVLVQFVASSTIQRDEVSIVNLTNTSLLAHGFTQPAIDAADYLEMFWGDGADATEILRVDFENRCVSDSQKHLLFLSTIGSLEPYTFIKRSREKTKIKGSGYEQQFGYFDDAGLYTYDLGGVTDYVKQMQNMVEVQSDWVSEAEYRWLCEELLTSPLVYLLDNGNLIQVRVTDKSYKIKTSENDMVFNLRVNIHTDNDISTIT